MTLNAAGDGFAPDPLFYDTAPPLAVPDASKIGQAEIVHSETDQRTVTHAAPADASSEGAVVFCENKRNFDALGSDGAAALVFTTAALSDAAQRAFPHATIAVSGTPKTAFALVAGTLHRSRQDTAFSSAVGVSPDAEVSRDATLAPSAVVMAGAVIGPNAEIGPFAVIGAGVKIGDGTRIGAHTSVSHALIGRGCSLAAGVRVGEAGFGYVPHSKGTIPMPQLGRVMIDDFVDLGANTTVDRGALSDTVIGMGTKIDNLVQIAHNCVLGRHVLIASQTGVSGSCTIGDGVMIGGQVGMADHVHIGDRAVIVARSGLMKDVPAGEKWGGTPAKPAREWMKDVATLSKLTKRS